MALAQFIGNYDNPTSIGSRFRQRRSGPLRDMVSQTFKAKGAVSIIDIGGHESYWNIIPIEFLRANNVRIVLVNTDLEQPPLKNPDIFSSEIGDGCALRFEDNSFDISHSNSVIEHVIGWQKKRVFVREASRVAPLYFHQSPNFWFPWEPHFGTLFFHWLPEPTKLWLSCHRNLGWNPRTATFDEAMDNIERTTLLTRSMMADLFSDGKILSEKIAGLTKSFIAVRLNPA